MKRDPVAELQEKGFTVLRNALPAAAIEACRAAFWLVLKDYLALHPQPNRGPHRHYVPMPFEPPCFARELFFNPAVVRVVRAVMDDRVVADQWGCDVPLAGSTYQKLHVDFQRPLFPEAPDLLLPPHALVVSFGLTPITRADGPIAIVPGTHRLPRSEALRMAADDEVASELVNLAIGDVLIRNPWALHRGTPNTTERPRVLASVRYVRRWYYDGSRDVNPLPESVWGALTAEERAILRFPRG